MTETTYYNTSAAGDWLDKQMPGHSPAYWRTFLSNNRRNDRPALHRIPFETMGRAAIYQEEALKEFVQFENGRREGAMKLSPRAAEALRAVGFNEQGGSSTGRRFEVNSITRQIDPQTGETFVQMMLDRPLMVYRLSMEQAAEVARELLDAAGKGQRQAATYKTVTDNKDMLIQRKEK